MKLAIRRLADRVAFCEWAYGQLGESDSDVGVPGEFVVARALGCLSPKCAVNAVMLFEGTGRVVEGRRTNVS